MRGVGEVAQVRLVPVGPTLVGQTQAEEERLQPESGGLEILHGVFAGAGEVADRFVLDRWDVDGGEITGAQQACEFDRVAAVGLDAVAGFLRDERGSDDETVETLPRQVAMEHVAAGASLVGEDEAGSLRVEPADELVDVALTGADGADEGDLGVAVLASVSDRDGVFVHIETDEKGGRLVHG